MKRKIIAAIAILFIVLSFPSSVYAHPGRTDSNGGHWDRKNGTYHYHNGGYSSSGSNSYNGSSGSYSYDYETTKRAVYASKVTIANPPENIDVGKSVNLEATVYPADAEDDEITWKSENPEIAEISDDNELIAVSVGTATIVAKTSRGTSSSFTVEVKEVVADSVSIQSSNKTMLIESTQKLKVDFVPNNTTYQDVKWTSSDERILSVNDDGLVSARGLGKARITAAHKDLKDSVEIEVLPIKADKISIVYPNQLETDENSEIPRIKINDTYTFEANISPSNVTDKTIVWSVSDEEKAEIDENGAFKALKSGVVTISVQTENGKKDSIEIEVYSSTPKTILSIIFVGFILAGAGVYFYTTNKKKKSVNDKV